MADRPQSEDGAATSIYCKFNDLLIEAFGVDGKSGRIGSLETRVEKLANMQFKIILAVCASAMIGGGAVKFFL